MVNYGFVAIAVVGIVLVAFCQQAFGLNCWECDTRDNYECAEGGDLPSSTYRHCDDGFAESPVCIKIVSLDVGVRRQCVNDVIQASNICNSVRDYDKTVNCKICDYDGCNGAISYRPIAAVLCALPMALMKILSI